MNIVVVVVCVISLCYLGFMLWVVAVAVVVDDVCEID